MMKTMLIMVKTKKGSGSMATFTMTAVIKNTSPMATRLPKMRICWGILQERASSEESPAPGGLKALPRVSQPKPSSVALEGAGGGEDGAVLTAGG